MKRDIPSFGSFKNRLGGVSNVSCHELLLVYLGMRRIARIHVQASDSTSLAEALSPMGLHVMPWRYALLPADEDALENYSFRARLIPDSSLDIGLRVLFVGREENELRKAESRAHIKDLHGQDLDYPDCCTRHYSNNSNIFMSGFSKLYGERVTVLPFYNNVYLDSFGWTLLSHFPCSPDCPESRKLAKRYLNVLMEFDPEYGNRLVRNLKSFVVYTPSMGILYALSAAREGSRDYTLTNLHWSHLWSTFIGSSDIVKLQLGSSLIVNGVSMGEDYTVYDCRRTDNL